MRNAGTKSIIQKTCQDWPSICASTAISFRLSFNEQDYLSRNRVARLIAMIPYIAKCDEAERTALAHLAVYITALRGGKKTYEHRPTDNADILERLRLVSSFKGGNPQVINRGMNLIALVMLCGYERDKEKDIISGKYNPMNEGIWDFETMKQTLLDKIAQTPSGELDAIFSIEDGLESTWS
jgi:hypothetical protein